MHRAMQTSTYRRLAVAFVAAIAVAMTFVPNADAARATYAPTMDRHIVTTKSSNLGPQLATWYGPGFYGNGTACGQRLTRSTWGIAHRTLPCGTLVTVSLGKRSVTVPVIDRGPYSGATVDLTSRTKSFLRFGSGRVKMSRVQRYRVVPGPKPLSGIVAIGTAPRG